jgi:7-carboxy-7-deazaguanine synthase
MMRTPTSLNVVEIFASLQGEGPSMAEPAVFLRLADCNLSCSWCDTRYSWDWKQFDRTKESRVTQVAEAAARIESLAGDDIRLVVVTGGEPLLQQVPIAELISRDHSGRRYEFETNGTIAPSAALLEAAALFVVSPKLANAGMKQSRRIRLDVLSEFVVGPSVFKFVISADNDVHEVRALARALALDPHRVWLMPEGTTTETVGEKLESLAPIARETGFQLSDRLHVRLWGDQRGR